LIPISFEVVKGDRDIDYVTEYYENAG
jgi:hypothetical protein